MLFYKHITRLAGSEEELSQLRSAYLKYQGDMKEIILHVMGATYDDEERFATILREWIDSGDVVAFDKFTKETKAAKERRRKWFQKEKKVCFIVLETRRFKCALYRMRRNISRRW